MTTGIAPPPPPLLPRNVLFGKDFHNSDDLDRTTNPFVVSTSTDGTTYTDSFEGVNIAGTPLGDGEDFAFPTGSSGRYVRFTGELAEDQWLSINEVIGLLYTYQLLLLRVSWWGRFAWWWRRPGEGGREMQGVTTVLCPSSGCCSCVDASVAVYVGARCLVRRFL